MIAPHLAREFLFLRRIHLSPFSPSFPNMRGPFFLRGRSGSSCLVLSFDFFFCAASTGHHLFFFFPPPLPPAAPFPSPFLRARAFSLNLFAFNPHADFCVFFFFVLLFPAPPSPTGPPSVSLTFGPVFFFLRFLFPCLPDLF